MFGIPKERALKIEQSANEVWHRDCAGLLPVATRNIISAHGIFLYRLASNSPFEAHFDLSGKPPYHLGIREPKNGERRSRRRLRFTEAHEVGHFLHHQGLKLVHREAWNTVVEAVAAENFVLTKEETEANFFAASLLMPRQEFERDVRGGISGGQNWSKTLTNKYDVSYEAIELRSAWLRSGHILSGYARPDTGNICSMIPSSEFELAEPQIAMEAWRCNPIVRGHLVRKLPFRILQQANTQIRALPKHDIGQVKFEAPNLPIREVLPGINSRIEGQLFICGCYKDGPKLFFEIDFACIQT